MGPVDKAMCEQQKRPYVVFRKYCKALHSPFHKLSRWSVLWMDYCMCLSMQDLHSLLVGCSHYQSSVNQYCVPTPVRQHPHTPVRQQLLPL